MDRHENTDEDTKGEYWIKERKIDKDGGKISQEKGEETRIEKDEDDTRGE